MSEGSVGGGTCLSFVVVFVREFVLSVGMGLRRLEAGGPCPHSRLTTGWSGCPVFSVFCVEVVVGSPSVGVGVGSVCPWMSRAGLGVVVAVVVCR